VSVDAREAVRLTEPEIRAMLEGGHKCQLATLNRDGTAHLVTMFYVVVDGHVAFWTYRASQKARNLERDPRVTCLVEDGEDYFELRGVQIVGVVRPLDDLADVVRIGTAVVGRSTGRPPAETADYVAYAATKRRAYLIEPSRTISWDHRKLVDTS
jgi:hypothetical protein